MTNKALEILERLDELTINLRDKALMALLGIHSIDSADGQDEEEKRRLKEGAYCVLWATVPEMPQIIKELEEGLLDARHELQA